MKRTIAFLAVLFAVSPVVADYLVVDKGIWPESWPKELEPLRKQSSTLEGPLAPDRHYAIRFSNRDEFEAAWPYILKVKSPGAAVRLVRGPNFFLGEKNKAGVVVHSPPVDQIENPAAPKGSGAANRNGRGLNETYIDLVVDGDIIDLNRIPLPADTPIIDERFKDAKKR
jgi:hypothetical protein